MPQRGLMSKKIIAPNLIYHSEDDRNEEIEAVFDYIFELLLIE